MVDIEFDFVVSDGEANLDPFLDEYEIQIMFDQTRQQIARHVEHKLAEIRCDEHGERPRVKVAGQYSNESEQLEIQYHIDGCCKLLILKAIQALNH